MKNKGLNIGIIIIVIIALVFGFYVRTRNNLIALDEDVNMAWAQVENQLKRRADLIPNLLETVKGYAGHEKEVIQGISDARAGYSSAKTPEDFAEAEAELSSAIKSLDVVVENYPDLKANQNFQDLQVELAGTENRIATERMRYNEIVGDYNKSIRRFPTSLVANMSNFEAKQYFEISEEDAETPKVKF